MAVDAVERLDMQRRPGISGEGLEELAHRQCRKRPIRSVRNSTLKTSIGRPDTSSATRVSVSSIGGRADRRSGSGHTCRRAPWPAPGQEADADVLDRVVIVDMRGSPSARDREVDGRVAGQLIEHMIEADAGNDVGDAGSVEIEGDLDAAFSSVLRVIPPSAHGDSEEPQGHADAGVIANPSDTWPQKRRL